MRASMSDGLLLRLFGECWRVDLSAYADPRPLVSRLGHLWARVRVNGHDASGAAVVVFRPSADALTGPRDPHVRTAYVTERTDGAFPYAFSRALTQAAIEHLAGSGLLLHAAALASGDGSRAVVMVASSGTGKSTAARTLGTRFGYLSDELVRVDASYRVEGLTKPLSIIVPGFPGGKDECSPDDEGLAPTPLSPPVLAAIVCLQRDPGADAVELQPIGVHELIAEVLPQSSSIWRGLRPLHHLVGAATEGGGPFRLRYAEIAEAERVVDDLLASRGDSRAEARWIGHPPADSERWTGDVAAAEGVPPTGAADAVVTRMPWTDAIECDGEVSVLNGPEFSRIAGIAATMWLWCAQPRTVAELTAALIDEHGPHPDAAQLVRSALEALSERRLVRVTSPADPLG
ncbi:hypothetical protein PTQ19_03095 [Microbacterium esteraromaticum]|uniref:hypothetical protein n=1 Tax=Microbacterium esteraromaticum TaxID=57043 RepID=UPI00236863E0|nr:hypothetical protein [Microbacterium esteraromaticum]WDH79440.1 hypothetical protein PTQ19_03095 [Microbacterium esteraromaticum]